MTSKSDSARKLFLKLRKEVLPTAFREDSSGFLLSRCQENSQTLYIYSSIKVVISWCDQKGMK